SSNALIVDEAYLEDADNPGSKAGKTPEAGKPGNTDEGSLVFTSPEGVDSITINDIPCTVEKSGDAYTVTIPAGASSIKTTMEVGEGKSIELGEISDIRLEYSADSGEYTLSYTYTQLDNYGKHEGQGTISKPDADGFEVFIQDSKGGNISTNVSVEIVDDVPTANHDIYGLDGVTASIEGNVLDNDVFGADGQRDGNYISWAGDVEGAPKDDQGRTIIKGKNGTLHVDQRGNFEYEPDPVTNTIVKEGEGFKSNIGSNEKHATFSDDQGVQYYFKAVEVTDPEAGAYKSNKSLQLDVTPGSSGELGIHNSEDSGNSDEYKHIGFEGGRLEGVVIDCAPGAGNLSLSYVYLYAGETLKCVYKTADGKTHSVTLQGNADGDGILALDGQGSLITEVLVYPGENSNFKLDGMFTETGVNTGGDVFKYTIYDGDGDASTGKLFFTPDPLTGGDGVDSISGTSSPEIIFGDATDVDAAVLAAGVSDYLAGKEPLSDAGKLVQSLAQSDQGGKDLIKGGDGDDIIFGMGGNDVIYGGQGEDIMFGGQGSNTFAWALDDLDGLDGKTTDKIMDFSLEDDKLRFDFEAADMELSALSANDLKLTVTGPGNAEVTIDIHLDGAGLNGVEGFVDVGVEGLNASEQMQAEIIQMLIANGGA
ncbi:hypothetical protein LJC36_05525, partial [Desulfovibrio sp. OttesenSCG-928-C14]|nr:hypothetical protein [Desulfovibrio sp. OttesenSCG-928-C14]